MTREPETPDMDDAEWRALSRDFKQVLDSAQYEAPPSNLGVRILDHIDYRSRLELSVNRTSGERSQRRWLYLSGGTAAVLAAAVVVLLVRNKGATPTAITPEQPAAGPSAPPTAHKPIIDPCGERRVASGHEPLVDDFEDGDDAVLPAEGRAGFWRWARETDAPGTAPALLPIPRLEPTAQNKLALRVKGGRLFDWGAAIEFTFTPTCYDASKYAGVSFKARGPGRIYFSPREVSVIPRAEGGTCERDCYNSHVEKIELENRWRTYTVRWADVHQRGTGKPPVDPTRLNSFAFHVRPEDTPYDVWLDDVRFVLP